jgi:hypothetical protein
MVQKQLVKTYCFSPFLLQHSRAVRSDETEKTLQAIERNEEKKLTTFVTEKREVSSLEKGSSLQRRNLCRITRRNSWTEAG